MNKEHSKKGIGDHTNNMLNFQQAWQLSSFIQSLGLDEAYNLTAKQLASMATDKLGFRVTENNTSYLRRTVFPEAPKPKAGEKSPWGTRVSQLEDRIAKLEAVVNQGRLI